MSTKNPYERLSRREQQILDILLEMGEATAEDVRSRLPDPPSYSAARAMLVKLEGKNVISHFERDLRYVYRPTVSPGSVRRSAVSRLVRVFFGGSIAKAVSGMIDLAAERLSPDEIDEISRTIDRARRRTDPEAGEDR